MPETKTVVSDHLYYRTDNLYFSCLYIRNKRRLIFDVIPILKDMNDNEYIFTPRRKYYNYVHHRYNNVSRKSTHTIIRKELSNWRCTEHHMGDYYRTEVYTYKGVDRYVYSRIKDCNHSILVCHVMDGEPKVKYYLHLNTEPIHINNWDTGELIRLDDCLEPMDKNVPIFR